MKTGSICFTLTALLLSLNVYAGKTQPHPVTIDYTRGGGSASGDMISARNSDNKHEMIGCGVRAIDDGAGGVYYWGFCQASLEENKTVTCSIDDNPALMEGIKVLSDSSFITFGWKDDGTGNLTCTNIGASTQSFYLEKGQPNW